MEKLASALMYEHPVHSLILDPEDTVWSELFSEKDLPEIREYKARTLPNLLQALQDCLDGLYTE